MAEKEREYFIIDGYNLIYASKELSGMLADFAAARDRLVHIVSEYGAYEKIDVTIVFDAPNTAEEEQQQEIGEHCRVVYTKAEETADSYIERLAYELARKKKVVRVVSSDSAIESVILGAGGVRVPSREFMNAIRRAKKHLRREYLGNVTIPLARHDVSTRLDEETLSELNRLRREDL